jgi:ATP phosphoribosyltransferase
MSNPYAYENGIAYTKRIAADSHEPCVQTLPRRVTTVMSQRQKAPAMIRIVENDAASIVAWPSAMRQRSELPANATSASAVKAAVRTRQARSFFQAASAARTS